MKRFLTIALIVVTCSGIAAGVYALTLKNPHFGPTLESRLMSGAGSDIDGGDYASAIEKYRLIIFRNPKNVDAYLGLADAFVLDGDPEGAIPYLRSGLKAQETLKLRDAYEKLMVVAEAKNR